MSGPNGPRACRWLIAPCSAVSKTARNWPCGGPAAATNAADHTTQTSQTAIRGRPRQQLRFLRSRPDLSVADIENAGWLRPQFAAQAMINVFIKSQPTFKMVAGVAAKPPGGEFQ